MRANSVLRSEDVIKSKLVTLLSYLMTRLFQPIVYYSKLNWLKLNVLFKLLSLTENTT